VPRFLHAADIHLDSPLQKLADYDHAPVQRIRDASRQALAGMVQLAIAQRVDLVVIAGDLYDGNWTDQNTGLQFVKAAGQLTRAGIPVVVIRGNHDAENVMTSSLPLPSNPDGSQILLASDQVESRVFESTGLVVHGRSFPTKSVKENLAVDYPVPHSGLFNIGLLHTSLTGAEGHDNYSPCTPQYLSDKQYQYWALGHVHQRNNHAIDDGPPIVFPGNLQGRHVRETGPKGCVIVDVDSRFNPTITFHSLDVVRWEILTIDAATLDDIDEVVDRYRQWLDQHLQAVQTPLIVTRVEIIGTTPLHSQLHRTVDSLVGSLQAIAVSRADDRVWMENIKLRTRAPVADDNQGDLDGPMRSLMRAMESMQGDEQISEIIRGELSSIAKKLPIEMQDGETPFEFDDPAWIAELIASAGAELTARLESP
jgi:DNA repair protein SbcD/Mre11